MHQFDPITARLLLVLVQSGSIGRAAERESIAPSAISRRLADLESRLGVVLFDRSVQGVRLTPEGALYVERARNILREIADLDALMGDYATGRRGSLRLACTGSALSGRLPEMLAQFSRDFPNIGLEIKEMSAAAALSALDDGMAYLAILSDNHDFARFAVDEFEDDRVYVIASPDHSIAAQLTGMREVAFDAVIGHEVVGIHHSGALDRLLNAAADSAGQVLGERVHVESFPSLVRMVEAGFGIGFLRHTSLHLLAATDLLCVPLSDEWARRKLLLARRKSSPVSSAMKAFMALSLRSYQPVP